ncbi:cytochrome c biogenesis protein [Cytobacillus horneckiae]|uniref:Cytochrome c biogenesis protein n=1 Tax=Cytobacillus horneckiae TaxID=549687 RepID=A0A2N0ZD15_9BACI|nr:cytochrome c biogenesis protein ResB [Cytobacillus horneckiae]MBN6888374.1 cytochrome c biogenesis protein [Cytobacillus horneckiae]MCM3180101.1 cytochrome c biogenesis protein ResB [Cytobacillus horneckiae]MEC1156586.1 cytochrome c biogenesis protein ResB [Cytobacillus horneckiae]MED2938889.1 cytochrome c biogenesis protein ResB [Cytobacillus horneckiae]PKG27401.1 cytochrome c biogenesis protein [Cytobacillus horneckiae]
MKQVKCECGHVNPHGTVLCESCGRVLVEEEKKKKLVDMRYEGSARRSQTYNKTIIDKIWNFFSSVKVGVTLIIITLAASAIGTIFPQEMYIPTTEPASVYYESQYGVAGKLYYLLGFHNLYSSWWYLLLIASIGISLVICSLDRVVPLYRALKNQKVSRHEGFLKRQRLFGTSQVEELDSSYELVKEKLKKNRYNIREENGNILAEKGRFSRWGPYINHIGLIIFLAGGMLRFVPGMYVDELLWVREGETAVIPETDGEYYLENHQFILEVYDKDKDNEAFNNAIENSGMVAKNFQSDVTLYKKSAETVAGEEPILDKVQDYELRVNEPLKFENFALYQQSYKLDELNKMSFALTNKENNEEFGDLTIDLYNPQDEYDLGDGYKVEVMSYFPDFEFDENSEPVTKSRIPNNPAFIFKMITPDKPDGEVSFVAIKQTIEPFGDNEFKMAFKGVETKNVTALTVRKDLTLGVLAVGGFIFMVGVVQGAYWNHRRIWIRRVDGEVWVAGHTNKNWHGLKREISTIFDGTGINEPKDQSDESDKSIESNSKEE